MESGRKNKIIVILGPTSSGKSDVAIRLAKKFDGEVISADSRQIYRGMDIGTGKVPVVWDKEKNTLISEDVPHHMIDILNPRTSFSAAQFKKKTEKIIRDIIKRGKLPIICGGTGFWIKAVVDSVKFPEVKPDPKLRDELSKKSTEELFEELKKIDPERAETIDAKNKVRLVRAIEICKAIGKVPPIDSENNKSPYEFIQIGITHPKEILNERIKLRLRQRFDEGMVEEIERLHVENGISWKRMEEIGLGYYWITQYFKGLITKDEAFEKTYQSEKDYAKRQMTWFRKDKRILWLDNYEDIEKEIEKFLK